MCRCPFVPRCRALSSSLYRCSRLATATSSDVALSRGILLLWRTEDQRCCALSSSSLYRRSRFATATSSDVASSHGLLLLWRTEDRRCVNHRSSLRILDSDIGHHHHTTWRRCPAGQPWRYRYCCPSAVATAILRHCLRDNVAIPRLTPRKNNHHLQIHIRRRQWRRCRRCSWTVNAAGNGGGGGGGGKTIVDSL
jgi:hypothetical protein